MKLRLSYGLHEFWALSDRASSRRVWTMSAHFHAIAANAMRARGPVTAGAAAALALVILASVGVGSAMAQNIPSGPAPAPAKAPAKAAKAAKGGDAAPAAETKKDPAAALKSLEAGVKAYETGKTEQAVQSISYALSGGGLPSQQMARALYYRGLAYRKQAKPAQAISDLTSAIWLKGGLGEAERAGAIENRAAAYREAGLGDPPPLADTARTASASASAAAAPVAAQAAKPAAAPTQNWQTATSGGAASVPAPASTSSSGASALAAAPAAPALAAAPAAVPVPEATGGAGSSVGNFFSGLFGGNSSTAEAKAAATPPTTASTGPAAATSSWSDATQVAAAKGNAAAKPSASVTSSAPTADASKARVPVQQTAAVAAAAPPAPPQPALKGKFRLQVAAVRSRAEAETLAQKLKQSHGASIGGREPVIEESVIGAMGTFYRVRVGPYADAGEPRKLCSQIKPDGFDCLVVTQ